LSRKAPRAMFERFTEASRAVVVEAQDIAVELGARHIVACHLLYGCAEGREETAGRPLREAGISGMVVRRVLSRAVRPGSVADLDVEALRAIGVDYDEVRSAVDRTFGAGALEAAPDRRIPIHGRGKPRLAPDAKRAFQLSLRVAVELRHKRIAPGHLLLGLLRVDDELVSSVIAESGASVAPLSAAVLEVIGSAAA
jgi:hypothetical protein